MNSHKFPFSADRVMDAICPIKFHDIFYDTLTEIVLFLHLHVNFIEQHDLFVLFFNVSHEMPSFKLPFPLSNVVCLKLNFIIENVQPY